MKKIIGNPNSYNKNLIELIKKTKINNYYLKILVNTIKTCNSMIFNSLLSKYYD